ncbi:hypothetical protein KEM55_003895 [Ascosphaera atra]|nr:hypothetical protein KEM55_003895 [Ascosphaera atra]
MSNTNQPSTHTNGIPETRPQQPSISWEEAFESLEKVLRYIERRPCPTEEKKEENRYFYRGLLEMEGSWRREAEGEARAEAVKVEQR